MHPDRVGLIRARRRCLSLLYAVVLAGIMAGCVQLEQQLSLTDGNGGSFAIDVSLPEALAKSLAAGKSGMPWLAPETGADAFPESEGFRISRYRVYQLDGVQHVKIAGRLTDAKKALATGKLGDFQWQQDADGGSVHLKLPPPTSGKPTDDEKVRKALAGFRCRLVVELPGAIAANTAHKRDGNTLTWEYAADKDLDFLRHTPDISASYQLK